MTLSMLPPSHSAPASATSTSPRKRKLPTATAVISPATSPAISTPIRKKARSSSAESQTISRSISACNRCRSRKTKCDQLFPSCTACVKAKVECVGVDAATGRKVPRSYVDWLEKRLSHLEEQLELEGKTPAEERWRLEDQGKSLNGDGESVRHSTDSPSAERAGLTPVSESDEQLKPVHEKKKDDTALRLRPDIENLINQVGYVSVEGTGAPRFLGQSSGISFARLMLTAVKSSKDNQQHSPSIPLSPQTGSMTPAENSSVPHVSDSMTQVSPRYRERTAPAPFPPPHEGARLMNVYFQQANPQFPILHRPTFEPSLDRVYGRGPAQGRSNSEQARDQQGVDLYLLNMTFAIASAMSSSTDDHPERYHAAAMANAEFLFSATDRILCLKALLLLALYSLMRPSSPGVWYVTGAALRLAVDLGLHQEATDKAERTWDALTLDERRRLWWCIYALDRQVCVYLGRPFGISDDACRTPFPVDTPDEYITTNGILAEGDGKRSYRTIAIHMFRIRQLQSEIQQILYQYSEIPRRFKDLEEWRQDLEERLRGWLESVPKSQKDTGCSYNVIFIELNYQQTRLLLHGLSPACPTPSDRAFNIIADSGGKIIQLYHSLNNANSINYSWLATHNLFMAATSYLCALWHCASVRAASPYEQIQANIEHCLEVLSAMIDRCPAAQPCRDVFDQLASSTLNLCLTEYPPGSAHLAPTHAMDRIKPEEQNQISPQIYYQPSVRVPSSMTNLVHVTPPPTASSLPMSQPAQNVYPTEQIPYDNGWAMDGNRMYRMGQRDSIQYIPTDMNGMEGGRVFEMIQEVGSIGGFETDGPLSGIMSSVGAHHLGASYGAEPSYTGWGAF